MATEPVIDDVDPTQEAVGPLSAVGRVYAVRVRGEYCGGLQPYGYRVEGERLVEIEAEQATIGRIVELSTVGMSLSKIVDHLEAEGWPPRGGRWHRSQVHRVLRRV